MILRPAAIGSIRSDAVLTQFTSLADQRAYAAEMALIAVTEALADAFNESGLTRSAVADRLGKNRSAVTRMLGGHNLTLKSVGEFFWACGYELADLALQEFGVTYVAPIGADASLTGSGTSLDGHVMLHLTSALSGREYYRAQGSRVTAPYTQVEQLVESAA